MSIFVDVTEFRGDRIEERRRAKGLSQAELGAITKLTRQTIGAYEAMDRLPGAIELVDIAKAVDTTVAYLMNETDDPSPDALRKEPLPFEPLQGRSYRPASTSEVENLHRELYLIKRERDILQRLEELNREKQGD